VIPILNEIIQSVGFTTKEIKYNDLEDVNSTNSVATVEVIGHQKDENSKNYQMNRQQNNNSAETCDVNIHIKDGENTESKENKQIDNITTISPKTKEVIDITDESSIPKKVEEDKKF